MGFLKRFPGLALLLSMGVTLAGIQGCGSAPPSMKPGGLQVGDKVPQFSLMDSAGKPVKFSDVEPGWCLVIILYRGYWCSACQNQLLDLKDDYPKFLKLHAALVAVSTDTIEQSATFTRQWRFPFPLLSDPHLRLIDDFGARNPHGHGDQDIAHPSTIIVDPQGIIRFKYIGKNPVDRPTDDEILFSIRQIEKQEHILNHEDAKNS